MDFAHGALCPCMDFFPHETVDVERREPMVIAGRAEPGQTVDVILGGEAIDRVVADSAGNFVSLPLAGPSERPVTGPAG